MTPRCIGKKKKTGEPCRAAAQWGYHTCPSHHHQAAVQQSTRAVSLNSELPPQTRPFQHTTYEALMADLKASIAAAKTR